MKFSRKVWSDQRTMGRRLHSFGQFRETARCRDAQHGDGVCCAFARQLVLCGFCCRRVSLKNTVKQTLHWVIGTKPMQQPHVWFFILTRLISNPKNSLMFHANFVKNWKTVTYKQFSTELYCLFIAADSTADAISFIRRIVL